MLRERIAHRYRLRKVAVTAVDVALVLAVDSSGSISNEDLALQFHGYAVAITTACAHAFAHQCCVRDLWRCHRGDLSTDSPVASGVRDRRVLSAWAFGSAR